MPDDDDDDDDDEDEGLKYATFYTGQYFCYTRR
jgi:hypothetical protein